MSSTAWDLPGTDGHGAAARLRAALATIRAGMDEALSTSTTSVEAAQLGGHIGELVVEDSRFDALKPAWIRQADACDIGTTTGAATTATWLRNCGSPSGSPSSAAPGPGGSPADDPPQQSGRTQQKRSSPATSRGRTMGPMDAKNDALAAFVEVLADALDDHAATGADLARRVHLSRFHLDRVVAAAAGEPPAALRRRVLMERAAYRLLTTHRSVLDVATEAGYSTHESFTRAFARAYGLPPTRWRARPTQVRIEAPSGIHFHPPDSLRLPARTKVSSMDLLNTMVEHHVWLIGEMLTRAETLHDDQLDSPIEISVEGIDDDPTLRSLLSRLIGQLDMWSAAFEGREYDLATERDEPVARMRERLARVGPAFLTHAREMSEQGRLDEAVICPGEPPEIYTYGAVIAHVLTFAAHRRTLAAGALWDAGFTDLEGDDPVRWITQRT